MSQIRIALLGSAVVIFIFLLTGGQTLGSLVLTICLAMPQLVLLGLSMSSRPAIQAAVTGSAIGLGIAALPGIGLVAVLGWLDAQFGHRNPLAEMAVIIAVPVHIWLIVAGMARSRTVGNRKAMIPWALLAPVVSFIWVVGVFQAGEAMTGKTVEAEKASSVAAYYRVRSLQVCLFRYSAEHGENLFPAKLAALHDPLCGSSNDWSEGGYSFTYAPGNPSADSATFFVLALPKRPIAFPSGYVEIRGDQSGVLTSHPYEGGLGYEHISILVDLYRCAFHFKYANPRRSYPKGLQEMDSVKDGQPSLCISWRGYGHNSTELALKADPYYRFEYSPHYDGDDVTSFVLQVRPRQYGHGVIRSYYVDSDSPVIHGTPYDRPATATDPPIPHCEEESAERCFQTPDVFQNRTVEFYVPKGPEQK